MSETRRQTASNRCGASTTQQCFDALPIPAFDLGGSGLFLHANPAALRLFDLQLDVLLQHSVWDFITSDQVKSSREIFFISLHHAGVLEPISSTLCDINGRFHTCVLHLSPLAGAGGERLGLRCFAMDATEALSAKEKSLHPHALAESLLASLPEAIIASDPLGFIVYVNQAAERLIGWTAKELQGKPLEKTLPLLDQVTGDQAIIAIETALEERASAATLMFDSEGRQIHVEISSAPWVDQETGSIAGVISILRLLEPGR